MERVDAAERQVRRLSALFERETAEASPGHEVVPLPDPRLALERERQEVLEQAREAGHAQGMKAAQDQIRQAAEAARRECEAAHADALAALSGERGQLRLLLQSLPVGIDAMEEAVVQQAAELAYEALLRLLGEMPAEERLLALCRQALRERHQRPLTIRLCEADAAAVAGLLDIGSLQIEADARLSAGQCHVDTAVGVHDTGFDVRLEQLRQAFLRGVGSARSPS